MNTTLDLTTKKGSTGHAILIWVAAQPGRSTGVTNNVLIQKVGLRFDKDRAQNRRFNDALAALRDKGLVDITYRPPHPKLAPSGRIITVTERGLEEINEGPQ